MKRIREKCWSCINPTGVICMFRWIFTSMSSPLIPANCFSSVGIVADSNAYDQSKRMRTGGDYTHTGYSSPSPFHPPPAPVWAPHG